MKDEQNMHGRTIGIVVMSDNHLKIVRDYVLAISEAIQKVKPGQVLPVFCGTLVRPKFKKPSP